MNSRMVLPIVLSALAIVAAGATTLRAQASGPDREMRELLRNLPREFEEFARLHPIPPPQHPPKVNGRNSASDEDTPCVDDVAPREDWRRSSEPWKEVIGTIAVCAVIAGVEKKLESRKR